MPYNTKPSYGRNNTRSRGFQGRPARSSNRRAKAYIDPVKFVKSAKTFEEEAYTPEHKFADFVIEQAIKANIERKGYETPTPIQDKTIPIGLDGKDIIGIANTGTGKTLAFAIPVINHLIKDPYATALIMAPTRELAEQIEDEFRWLAKGTNLHSVLIIGGKPIWPQIKTLARDPHIIIGTPGRIKDHIERGTLKPNSIDKIVLDEVDRMLDMGFINDVRTILASMPAKRQSFFFSATMDNTISGLVREFMDEPQTVSVKTTDTADTVEQNIMPYVSVNEKIDLLHALLSDQGIKALVFDDTQRNVDRLQSRLTDLGHDVVSIHGGKNQTQRQQALRKFKENAVNVMVATDVAARGIDIADITHVINYSTPHSYEDYVHRIGRAGRAGRKGHAITFVDQASLRRPY